MKSLSITVRGRVQGVGFRYQTQNAARKFGVNGWVRNMPDGSVYIEATAPEKNLEFFLVWCKKGPLLSRVTEVIVNDIPTVEYSDFGVRY